VSTFVDLGAHFVLRTIQTHVELRQRD
jgi:hypothetical protein